MSSVACLVTLPQLKDFLSLHRPRLTGGWGDTEVTDPAADPFSFTVYNTAVTVVPTSGADVGITGRGTL